MLSPKQCCRNNAFPLHSVQIPFFHYTINLSLPRIKIILEEHLQSLDMQTSDVLKNTEQELLEKDLLKERST